MTFLTYDEKAALKAMTGCPSAEAFAALPWPEQTNWLRWLDNLASAQQGRTYDEAQRKREPVYALYAELQKIHDQQVARWVAESPTVEETSK